MNVLSLWDNLKLDKVYGSGEIGVTSVGVVHHHDKKLTWFVPELWTFDIDELSTGLVQNCNGNLIGVIKGCKVEFYQPHSKSAFYSVDIDPEHITDVKSIKVWVHQAPSEFARIIIHTMAGLYCYTFDDHQIYTVFFPNNNLDGFNFVNDAYIYAWNATDILRIAICPDSLTVIASLPNLFSSGIENIIATPRFLLVHTSHEGVATASQVTGICTGKVSSEKFTKIHLFQDEKKYYMIGVLKDEIRISELNQKGYVASDVYSLNVPTLSNVVIGANSLYLRDQSGHYWITKVRAQDKLQRFVNAGDLATARRFAKHYNLSAEIISKQELEDLVRKNEDLNRIKELLTEITDPHTFLEIAQTIQGDSYAEKIIWEHVHTMEKNEDTYEMYIGVLSAQSNTEWLSTILNALSQGHYSMAKTEIFSHISDLTDGMIPQILEAIPTDITCAKLLRFLEDVVELLAMHFSDPVKRFLPNWIVERVTQFELSDPDSFPSDCSKLVDLVSLEIASTKGFDTGDKYCRQGLYTHLHIMRDQLTTLNHLYEKYNLHLSFEEYNEYLLSPKWQIKLTTHELQKCYPREFDKIFLEFVIPFLTENCIDPDPVITQELSNDKWSTESRIKLIESIEDNHLAKAAVLKLIKTVTRPWPKNILALVVAVQSRP